MPLSKSRKLGPRQIILISENGTPYIYDIEDEAEYEFLKSRGEWDEDDNLVLKMPLIAAARRFTLDSIMKNINKYETSMSIPSITLGFEHTDNLEIKDIHKLDNQGLEECLSKYGGYKSYLESQLSYIEAKNAILENSFEESLMKDLYLLEAAYFEEEKEKKKKKPNKEALRGEVLANNMNLNMLRKQQIEMEAFCLVLKGKLQACKSVYDATSRIVALRTMVRDLV